jgi:hypothetical protein
MKRSWVAAALGGLGALAGAILANYLGYEGNAAAIGAGIGGAIGGLVGGLIEYRRT